MPKRNSKKSGFVALGIIIIIALIIAIIFLLKLSPSKSSKSKNQTNSESLDLTKYRDSDGNLKSVDTTIRSIKDSQYKYANITNNFQTYFTDKPQKTDSDIKIQKNNASISFKIINHLVITNKDSSGKEIPIADLNSSSLNFENSQVFTSVDGKKNSLKYSNIYQKDKTSMDVVYTVYNDHLSEEIVVNQFLGFPKFSQNLKLNNTYITTGNGQINFYQKTTNELLWFIPQPKMYEKNNLNQNNNGLHYDISCLDSSKSIEMCDEIILTKTLDESGKKWLSDSNRKYPIIIDPYFQINAADNTTGWVSSDVSNLVVSQENTIKHEGTGSIKIVSSPKCWQLSGSCSPFCQYNSLGVGTTAYSSCTGNSCSGNCWSTDGITCDSNCTHNTYTTGTVATGCSSNYCGSSGYWSGGCSGSSVGSYSAYTSCSWDGSYCQGGAQNFSPSGSTTLYSVSGSCSGDGSGSCYGLSGSTTTYSYSDCSACGGQSSGATGYYSCSWSSTSLYSYTAVGSTASVTFSGSCAAGSGTCYKSKGTGTYYTNGSGCNGSYCGTSTYDTGATACSWLPTGLTSYSKSGSTTNIYNFSGATACNSSGTGNCYASGSGYSSWYCGDGSGCGGTSCSNCSASYYSPSTCTFSNGSDQDTVTLTSAATDLSASGYITFWVYSADRTGSFLQFGIGNSNPLEQTFNFSIGSTNTWEQKKWDIRNIPASARNAITKFTFKNIEASTGFTFYFDDIRTKDFVATPNPPTSCLIKESTNDSYLYPFWLDNSTDEDGFQLEKSVNNNSFYILSNLGVNTTMYQDTSISQGNTYVYRIRSYKFDVGETLFSDYCNFPNLDLTPGNLRLNGLKINGIKFN